MDYEIEPLKHDDILNWDELIAPFESRELFHQRAWLDYLAASQRMEVRMWAILERGRRVGYFCGGVIRKGPFRILGSPLKGWGTNYMGPILNSDFDENGLLKALDNLARRENIAMIELEHRTLSDVALQAASFEVVPGWTFVVTLDQNVDSMWSALDSKRRNSIRKAQKAGLIVEDTDDPAIVDEFYEQYSELMGRKGLVPSFPREAPRLLLHHLKPSGLLLALRVKDQSNRVLATGFFPHDDRTIYFSSGASWHDGRDLCPNDLLHWSVMQRAAELGLRRYDMSGHGRFKEKFGGELVALKRWHKCYWRSARWGRRAYEFCFKQRIRLRGVLQRNQQRMIARATNK